LLVVLVETALVAVVQRRTRMWGEGPATDTRGTRDLAGARYTRTVAPTVAAIAKRPCTRPVMCGDRLELVAKPR
jgi:hypothetical protein